MLDAGVDTRRASQSARGACEPRANFGDAHAAFPEHSTWVKAGGGDEGVLGSGNACATVSHLGGLGHDVAAEGHLNAARGGAANGHVEENNGLGHD